MLSILFPTKSISILSNLWNSVGMIPVIVLYCTSSFTCEVLETECKKSAGNDPLKSFFPAKILVRVTESLNDGREPEKWLLDTSRNRRYGREVNESGNSPLNVLFLRVKERKLYSDMTSVGKEPFNAFEETSNAVRLLARSNPFNDERFTRLSFKSRSSVALSMSRNLMVRNGLLLSHKTCNREKLKIVEGKSQVKLLFSRLSRVTLPLAQPMPYQEQ